MSDNEIMKQWKKSSIVIGSPTNILAALTSFIPVIWLCTTYDCWPPISTVLTAWGMVCLLYTSPSPRDPKTSRMPSSA